MGEYDKAQSVLQLIRGACTLNVFREFLKEKNLPHSASTWDDLFEKRVKPAMDVGTLTSVDLNSLLRSVEEHGRQHVFLYQCAAERAKLMLDEKRVRKVAQSQGVEGVMDVPLALELPAEPTIVDARWEYLAGGGKVGRLFVIKVVETRTTYEFAGQVRDTTTGVLTKQFKPVQHRAVNLARLHPDGLLEIRLASHRNSSQYNENLLSFLSQISPWFLKDEFTELSLAKAKRALWDEREVLAGKVRHGGHTMKNDVGTTLTARCTSPQDDVIKDGAAEASLKSFLEDDGHCDSSQIYFKVGKAADGREVQIILHGAPNEFAIPLVCSQEDFEYVFAELRTLNS
jgi:hypothetical protein